MNKKMIVFGCHPNDETWGCGGTITKRISEGYEVTIVVMTDGRNLFRTILGIDDDPTPEEVIRIRREEIMRATGILGVQKENLIFLDYEDGALEKHEKEAEGRIRGILEKLSPAEVYFTYINDTNRDHRALNRIVSKCTSKLNSTPIKYQYSIKHKYARFGPIIERLLSLLRKNTIEVDISEFLRIKEKAAKEYKTEVAIISSKQKEILEKNIERYLKNKEMFYKST